MTTITTTRNTPAGPKAFTWSYSRLKNFETCPKRHWHIDIQKDVKEDESEQLTWGNLVHTSLANRLSKGTPLGRGMEAYESWCKKIEAGVTSQGKLLVEQKLAINADFSPTTYFAKDVWYRSVADVIVLQGPVALAVDWKTGKILEDAVQLALMACCIFAHYPEVQKIRTEFIWLKEDATSRADFSRQDMISVWRGLWPRIEQLRRAHETSSYPPKPGALCRRWCPVRKCPHYGE